MTFLCRLKSSARIEKTNIKLQLRISPTRRKQEKLKLELNAGKPVLCAFDVAITMPSKLTLTCVRHALK